MGTRVLLQGLAVLAAAVVWSQPVLAEDASTTTASTAQSSDTVTHTGKALDKVTHKKHDGLYPDYPKVDYGTGAQAELIKKGEYLVTAGDCISCHTNVKGGGKQFAGGLGLETPFGTYYTPNITADEETGIGKWTDDDFVRAVHDGLRPDYTNLFPVFSYPSYTYIIKEDLLAIKAYLFAIPKVKAPKKKNAVRFPYNIRLSIWGWKLLFFRPGYYKPDPHKTKQWNRGAYLVKGLGHCGECHTPRNKLGAMETKYFLTGAFVDGFYAPNITSYGLKDATISDVVDVFAHEKKLGGAGEVGGPMAEVDHNSLEKLTNADLMAIAVYLKSLKVDPPPKVGGHEVDPSGKLTQAAGKEIYETYCSVCHNTGAAGSPKFGDATAWKPIIAQGKSILYSRALKGYNAMPARGTCASCTDNEIYAAVDYMVAESSGEGAKASEGEDHAAKAPEPLKKLTLADGKKLYVANCAVCHDSGALSSPKLGDKAAWKLIIAQGMDVVLERAINGYKGHPKKGACYHCTNREVIAMTIYMVEQGKSKGDYTLW